MTTPHADARLHGLDAVRALALTAGVVLHAAHRDLQKFVIARDLERLAHEMSRTYADLVYNGLWFSHTREAIDAFVGAIQPRVSGTVRLKLFKGDCRVVGRRSPFALYDPGLARPDAGDLVQPGTAEGFTKIWGLPVETAARKAAGTRTVS